MSLLIDRSVITITLTIFFSFIINAQSDVILKTDGQEMKGKVTRMNDTNLEFIYENETIPYTVKKNDIVKITFASGRVEFLTNVTDKLKLDDHHNKVAVLPFGYLKDQETTNVTMQKKIQQDTYSAFKKKAINLTYQDPITTNAFLAKAGVSNNNIEGYTMGEIATILGVEYVIQGMVTIPKTSSMTNNYATSNKKNSKDLKVDTSGKIIGDIWGSSKTNTYSGGIQTQNYSTTVTVNIYTDKGENIYNKDYRSFWITKDAYKTTLAHLAKHTPLYKK